jgi:hypothetical protein
VRRPWRVTVVGVGERRLLHDVAFFRVFKGKSIFE